MNRYLISFPRSGQHLTHSIIRDIHKDNDKPFKYCNTYQCHNQLPCPCQPDMQKWHDGGLHEGEAGIDIKQEDRYVVLYRNDWLANIEAYYRLQVKIYGEKYSYIGFLTFYKSKYNYYEEFFKKWVISKEATVISIDYDDLIKDPDHFIRMIISHFEFEVEIPELKTRKVKVYQESADIKKVNFLDLKKRKKLLDLIHSYDMNTL